MLADKRLKPPRTLLLQVYVSGSILYSYTVTSLGNAELLFIAICGTLALLRNFTNLKLLRYKYKYNLVNESINS